MARKEAVRSSPGSGEVLVKPLEQFKANENTALKVVRRNSDALAQAEAKPI